MAREWTKEQKLAIDTRDRTLLVSAAAGSGKTATLTERIISSILDEEHPADIGKMLIVTFTNAAVGELRERIGAAVKSAFAEHPDNKRLEAQLLTVKDAKIMTISSFCNDVLRANSAKVGLPANYRIADDAETALILSSVMEPLINLAFEGELPDVASAEEFAELADMLTGAKSSAELSESFKLIYGSTKCCADRMNEIKALHEKYDPTLFRSVENTEYGAEIMARAKEIFECYAKLYDGFLHCFDAPDAPEKLARAGGAFFADRDFMASALDVSDYESMQKLIENYKFPTRATVSDSSPYDYERFCEIREMLKEEFADLRDNCFTYSTEEWRNLYINLYKYTGIIYRFIKKFDEIFTEEKKAKGVCEFSDLERYTYLCLYDGGKPNSLAEEMRESFEAIYIDEYQDVNDLQNAIFAAISREDNRFMVGDIKQSIYGFRLANPDIFSAMKKAFPPLGTPGDRPKASLFMSRNFRSDKVIIDFANGIFDTLFGKLGESIGYVPDDRLIFSKKYGEGAFPLGVYPEIHVIERAPKKTDADESAGEREEREIIDAARLEASKVALKIRELIDKGKKADGTRILPSDIAIMMRSTNTAGDVYKEELARLGIGSSIKGSGSFFLNEEILLALSLLNSIDNPRKDIYLASLMCSPLYSFTPDELVRIRRSSESETLFEALTEYCSQNGDYTKGKNFLSSLERYRAMAEGMSIDTLIGLLYKETGLLSLAAKSGGGDNLILLHSYARKFESSSFKGLYSFINYVNRVISEGEDFAVSDVSDKSEDAVNIITVHKSKGLEYAVCFLVSAQNSTRSTKSPRLLYDQNFGIGLREKDSLGLSIVENPVYEIIKRHMSDREYEEKIRVLYVALTRAREQLYIYGTPPGKPENLIDKCELMRETLTAHTAKNFKSVLMMIISSYDKTTGKLIVEPYSEKKKQASDGEKQAAEGAEAYRKTERENLSYAAEGAEDGLNEEGVRALEDELCRRFEFEYPRKHMTSIPAKLSVSRLYPEILDASDDNASVLEGIDEPLTLQEHEEGEPTPALDEKRPILPAFADGGLAEESAKRGIATHLVLQFADFERLEKEGARAETERLKAEKYISDDDAARVRVRELEEFVRSPLFTDIKSAKKLYRELRFNVKLPAAILTADEERKCALERSGDEVLVQGVIDCLIETADGKLKLIDYKTDRLGPNEKTDTELGERRLADKHRLQLSYYRLAVEKMFGRLPDFTGIYSLALGKEIEIK